MIRRFFSGPLATDSSNKVRKPNSIRFELLSAESSNWMQMRHHPKWKFANSSIIRPRGRRKCGIWNNYWKRLYLAEREPPPKLCGLSKVAKLLDYFQMVWFSFSFFSNLCASHVSRKAIEYTMNELRLTLVRLHLQRLFTDSLQTLC